MSFRLQLLPWRWPRVRDLTLSVVSSQVSSWVNFTPASFNPALWLDAADTATITQSGGAVSQWNDKSGNGRHAVQATGAAQPKTGTVVLGGKNALSFDGNDILVSPSSQYWSSTDASLTAFAVFSSTNPNDLTFIISGDDGVGPNSNRQSQTMRTYLSALQILQIPSNVIDSAGVTITATTPFVGCAIQTSSTVEMKVNGRSDGASSFGTATPTVTKVFSIGGISSEAGYRLTGRLGEVIVYPRALSYVEEISVLRYLNAKWSVF